LTDREYAKPIVIGNNIWIASNVVITGGVHIGNGSVIAAGSVVTHDIPENVLAAGVPCKVIRPITEADSIKLKKDLW
jgi:maltose O-acetyltransferase